MQAGFLGLEAGLTRTKNAINVAIKNLADFGVSVVVFWLVGFGIMFGVTANGWFGADSFALSFAESGTWLTVFFVFQVMFAGTAVTIVSGAIAERLRFLGYIFLAFFVSYFRKLVANASTSQLERELGMEKATLAMAGEEKSSDG